MGRLLPLLLAILALPAGATPWRVVVADPTGGRPRVVLAPRASSEATLVIAMQVGAVDDGIRMGLTRLTQHMILAGSARSDEFQRQLYAAGADLDVTTDVREATFRLTAPKERFEDLAAALLEMTFAPKLVTARLPRAKRLTLNDELAGGSREDLVSFVAGSVIMMEGSEEGGDYNNQPYGDPQVLRGLTFEDVQGHLARRFTPANATLIAAGGFSEARLKKILGAFEGGVRRESARPNVKQYLPMQFDRFSPREIHLQVQLVELGSPQQAAAAHLLAALLEDRVLWHLRRKGVTYGIGAYVVRREWLDFLVVEVPVAQAGEVLVEAELKRLFGELAAGRFLPGEFERNKGAALGRLAVVDRDPALLADALTGSAGRAHWHSTEVRAALEEMTQAQLLAEARGWLASSSGINFLFGRTRTMPLDRGAQ